MTRSGRGPGLADGLVLALSAAIIAAVPYLAGATFAAPAWLHLAWLAPGVLGLEAWAGSRRRAQLATLGTPEAVGRLMESGAWTPRRVRAHLAALALLFLAAASARPQWGLGEEPSQREGVDVVVCVDVSRSMDAEDVKPSRLAVARLAAESLLEHLAGHRVAVVAYAGEARLLCPLTSDRAAARLFLDRLDTDLLQRPGTAMASALEVAADVLGRQPGRSGAIVVIGDGEDHAGDAVSAARTVAAVPLVVHAVGVGRPTGVPIPVREQGERARGVSGFLKDEAGRPVMTSMDEALLTEVARVTGGRAMTLTARGANIAGLARDIGSFGRTTRWARSRRDRAAWFLVPALVLLVTEALLPEGARPGRTPAAGSPAVPGRRAPPDRGAA